MQLDPSSSGERLGQPAARRSRGGPAGLPAAVGPARSSGSAEQGATADADADLHRVADLLHPVFTATDATERASESDLLTSVGVRPALRADGSAIQPAWLIADSRDALLAGAATALHAQLVDHTPDRLGTCSGHRCADVYIDASPAGDRRFCSITCQTRTRVAAFRQRKTTAR